MPWQESCIMDERMKFLSAHLEGADTMAGLCERYGISRKTGYVWVKRYAAFGAAGLVDRSHAPHHHGFLTAPALCEAIVELRRDRPHWGARKIVAKLAADHPGVAWPSA